MNARSATAATLKILRDDLAAQLAHQAATGHLLAPEMMELMNGKLPSLPHRWELHEAVSELVVLALTNCVAPYEIDPGDAPMRALEDIAVELGFPPPDRFTVARAIKDVQLRRWQGRCAMGPGIDGRRWRSASRRRAGGAGSGGTSRRLRRRGNHRRTCAFGPGGMVGGLAMLGGLAGTGAAAAAAAVVGGSGPEEPRPNLEKLMMRVAAEHARKLLDLPHDTTLWYQLTDFECQVSAVINRLTPFNDPKSPKLVQLAAAQAAINALLRFMIEHGLSPAAITDGEPKAVAG